MYWKDRANKKSARNKLFENLNHCKKYLTLCGKECIDIKTGSKLGILNPQKTLVVAVEKDNQSHSQINHWLESNWTKYKTFKGELHNYKPEDEFDLAYLDYFGNLTEKDFVFIKNLPLTSNSTVGITVSFSKRNNIFIKNLDEYVNQNFPAQCRNFRNDLIFDSEPKITPFIVLYKFIFKYVLFHTKNFKLTHHYYKDTTPMIFFKLTNIRNNSKFDNSIFKDIEKTFLKISATEVIKSFIQAQKTNNPTLLQKAERLKSSYLSTVKNKKGSAAAIKAHISRSL